MGKRLHVEAAAFDEVEHACDTLDESRDLGDALLDAFYAATELIRESPESFPPLCRTRFGVARSKLIRRFRYRVVYIDLPKIVWIIAFAHQRQRPLYWLSRLKSPPPE